MVPSELHPQRNPFDSSPMLGASIVAANDDKWDKVGVLLKTSSVLAMET